MGTALEVAEVETQVVILGPLDEPGITFTATGLKIEPWVPYEQWEQYGRKLQLAEKGIQWALGDWMIHGETFFRERASQAVEFTGLKIKTLQNYATVAHKVEKSRRRDSDLVDFSTHAEVACLPDEEQERILAKAESDPNAMTVKHVRREVHKAKRRMGKEKSELEIIHTPEVQEWLTGLLSSIKEHEPNIPLTASFLKPLLFNIEGAIQWQIDRCVTEDCAAILEFFDTAARGTDDDIFKWLQSRFYFMRDPELDERLEYMVDNKMLKRIKQGGRKDGQKGDMVDVYQPYDEGTFD